MLTEAQIKAMRERCEKATPGEWKVSNEDVSDQRWDVYAPAFAESGEAHSVALVYYGTLAAPSVADGKHNADFIAAARSDLPAALDAVEMLERQLATARAAMDMDEVEDLRHIADYGELPTGPVNAMEVAEMAVKVLAALDKALRPQAAAGGAP